MATQARVFHGRDQAREPRALRDDCALRALPLDEIVFYAKPIDNSRLVKQPDPKSGGACWAVIGAACMAVALLTAAGAVRVSATMDGYKLEQLRSEQRGLLDEDRALDLKEAELVSPERLQQLAKGQNLVTPSSRQVYHLETRADGAVAMMK